MSVSVYSLNNKRELRALVREQIVSVVGKVWEQELPLVTDAIQSRLSKTLVQSVTLSQTIKKELNLKVLPKTAISHTDYVSVVQELTSDKTVRGKLYQYRTLAMRVALLRTLLDKEASKKKMSFKVTTILEAVVESIISGAVNEVAIGQVVHKSAKAFKVNYIITKEGDKITEVSSWMIDELVLQLVNELAEMDMLNMRVSQKTHMVSIPDGLAARVSKDEWYALARDAFIARRKTILTVEPEVGYKNMVSRSSWYYRTPQLSESVVEFLNIMNGVKYNFTSIAASEIRERFLNHLKINKADKLPLHVEEAILRLKDQIKASNNNGHHYVAGIFDSANRYYLLSEVGHFQTSSSLRSIVEVKGIENPVKWDMRNNVTQMYAVSLRNKALGSSCGLVADKDSTEDIRKLIAKELNKVLNINDFSKDNIKPLFMVWSYNAGQARILEGGVRKERDFLTGREIANVVIPGLKTLSNYKISDENLWNSWENVVHKHASPIVALKMLFRKLIKHNPLTEVSWVLPDNTIAQYSSVETVSQELNWVSSNGTMRVHTHHRKEIVEDAKAAGLLPRVIHSIDAYLMRQLVIRMHKKGIIIVPNHDSFLFSKKHETTVIKAVKQLLIEIMEKDVLSDIVGQLNKSGKALTVKDANGETITADMFGEQLTREDIMAGSPMAKEEL